MLRRRLTVIGVALALAACGAPRAAEEGDEARLRAGAALYERHCAVCHGSGLNAAPGMTNLRAFAVATAFSGIR